MKDQLAAVVQSLAVLTSDVKALKEAKNDNEVPESNCCDGHDSKENNIVKSNIEKNRTDDGPGDEN